MEFGPPNSTSDLYLEQWTFRVPRVKESQGTVVTDISLKEYSHIPADCHQIRYMWAESDSRHTGFESSQLSVFSRRRDVLLVNQTWSECLF